MISFMSTVDEISDIVYLTFMGRPPLNMTPTLVRFPGEVLERVDALVGDKHRAQFIREAVVIEVERREQSGARKKASARKTKT